MRIETALLATLALASLGQDCGGRPPGNSTAANTANTGGNSSVNTNASNMNSNANMNARMQAGNENDVRQKPSPARPNQGSQHNDAGDAARDTNAPHANQKKIPFYGELGRDAPPANLPVKKPEPKSSPR